MKNKKNTKRKKWILPRHKRWTKFIYTFIKPYIKINYGFIPEPFDHGERQYFIISNHQTPLDMFFCGLSFNKPLYTISSEDLFSNGFFSKVIVHSTAPIPIKKNVTDIGAVMNTLRVAKEGGSIVLFPEGNRTYSGKTEYIKPSVIGLIRMLKLPLAIYRIEGGYGVIPRWADKTRKGEMRAYVSKVIEYEEIKALSDDELFALVKSELYVNDAVDDKPYYSKKNAEYLERVLYVCPECGLSEFESKGSVVKCKKCGLTARYTEYKTFEPVKGQMPFKYVNDWYEYQNGFVNGLDLTQYCSSPIYCDSVNIYNEILYKNKQLLYKNAKIMLYGDKITFNEEIQLPFDKISAVTVLGRNKLDIYFNDKVYQIKGDKSFNAVKYVNIYHRYVNIAKGEHDEQFLGL